MKHEYRLVSFEVPSGKGRGAALSLNAQVQAMLNEMASDGWRLASTESEIYFSRTTWLRMFWEREHPLINEGGST